MMFNSLLSVFHNVPCSSFALQQVRTTFILKRMLPLPLHKSKQRIKKLRGRHCIYELIEDTTVSKSKLIDVVLKQYVEGFGSKGDILTLKPQKAYNKLLLPGLAAYATPENLLRYRPLEDGKKQQHSSPFAQRTVNMLERLILAVVMNKENPWVIEPWHIKVSLRKCGYICNDDCITLPEQPIVGPDLSKENKEFYCTVTINKLEKARVRCRIHHWSTDPSDRLPFVMEHWKQPAEQLFPNENTKNDAEIKKNTKPIH